jgi:hypothetical protein
MTRPRLATLIFVALLSSLISLGTPWLSVYTLGQIRVAITASVALAALILTFGTTLIALAIYRMGGLGNGSSSYFGRSLKYYS